MDFNETVRNDLNSVLEQYHQAVEAIPLIKEEIIKLEPYHFEEFFRTYRVLKKFSMKSMIKSSPIDKEIVRAKVDGLKSLLEEKQRISELNVCIPEKFLKQLSNDIEIEHPAINRIILGTYLNIKNGMCLEQSRVLFKGTISSHLMSIEHYSKNKAGKRAEELSNEYFGDARQFNAKKKGNAKLIITNFIPMIKLP